MPHQLDASGNPIIRHGRPSPKTQGVTEEGETFQMYGTQQLVKDPTSPTGVTQVNTGKGFKALTTSGYTGTLSTAFSQQIQAGITGHQSIMPRAEAIKMQDAKLAEMGIPKFPDLGELEFPDLGDLFGNGNGNDKTCTKCDSDKCEECDAWDVLCEASHGLAGTCTPPPVDHTKNGCECEACKNGTGECSDKKPCCNAWDILCEMGGECSKPPKPNECGCLPFDIGCEIGCWWEKNKNYVYIIGGLIGLGILLWLLRPLFGIAKNITD